MERLKTIGILSLVALSLPLIVVWVALYLLWFLAWGVILRIWFWRAHVTWGRHVLFVYSESPNWKSYIEENILPRIRARAVVLNWSERRLWHSMSPWEARFFNRFSGDREFNPLALVFCSRGQIRVIRFYKAFRDFKHGEHSTLRRAETQLFELVETAT